ncbi:hypothetical protein CISG_06838 [Coccidioides immitis RMSCC 3703]|uniref:BBC1/AIM3 cysteine proteinase-fold domain-containing protein n=1 Tax=Coccidioides immitis RMSCC 3703 TaxID=454286 RepID=A0A0J8R055_COCIT|nr:hypothetical protein CISG_06838 [Coccidioides immitis RMSCC 3703]
MSSHPSENIPLALSTHWFLATPPTFPYPELRAHAPISSATYTWEYIERIDPDPSNLTTHPGVLSQDWTVIGAVQWELDMSITRIRVQWNTSDITNTLRSDIKHLPSSAHGPRGNTRELTREQLLLASQWYAPHILSFARSRLGTTVADGECWSLASAALQHTRGAAVREGHEPPQPSTGRVHGQLVLDWDVSSLVPAAGILQAADVRAGDVLELSDAHFRHIRVLLGGLASGEENVQVGEHTAIVDAVEGEKVSAVEQNARVEREPTPAKPQIPSSKNPRTYHPLIGTDLTSRYSAEMQLKQKGE